jgi:hypothetical protein
MADGAPNQIDVQLSLLGDESKQEVSQLTGLLTELVSRMPAAGAFSAETANRVAAQPVSGGQGTGGSHGFASTAQVGTPQTEQKRLADAQGEAASRPDLEAAARRELDTFMERRRHEWTAFRGGERNPVVDAAYPIAEDPEAQARAERSGRFGRAVDAHFEAHRIRSGEQSSHASQAPDALEPESRQPYGSTTGNIPPGAIGGASTGGTAPPPPPPGVNQAAYSQFQRLLGGREDQPRFGEWQTQDYLRMAARTTGAFGARRAERQHADAYSRARAMGWDEDVAQNVGAQNVGALSDWTQRGGAALARAEQAYPTVHALGGWVARTTGVGQHDYSINRIFNPTQGLERMAGSGYESREGGTIGFDGFGVQAPKILRSGPLTTIPGIRDINPFATEAGRESGRQGWEAWRAGMADPTLGVERAGEVNDLVNERGWNRPEHGGRNEAFKEALWQVYGDEGRFGNMEGLSTEAAVEFMDNFTHLGQNTFPEVQEVMENFEQAAVATGLSLDEVAQQATAAAEAIQEFGGTGLGGARFGEQWMRTTGTPAEVGTQMLNNPWFQTQVARAGVNPAYAGAMPDEQLTRMSVAAVEDVDRMVRGTHDNRTHAITVNGRKIGEQHTTGREQDDAMAAAQLGMDVDVFRNLRDRGQELSNLEAATSAFENQLGVVGRERDLSGLSDEEIEEAVSAQGGRQGIDIGELQESMDAAGFTVKQRREVMEAVGGVEGSIKKIRDITAEMTGKKGGGDDGPKIGLTPEAKRWFEINNVDEHGRAKNEQNRGGARLNAMMGMPPPTPRASNAPR